jgi:nitroimidazol reductase NimA-like FMN-containing flavoprotein (pyridoxamine 5'-phosphate oxidase superfamily)
MPHDYASLPPTATRRRDRAVTDEAWIEAFLARAAVGTLSTVHDGQPFLNTNLFAFDADRRAVYLHTAHVGRTAATLGEPAPVCFSVFEMGRLLPADRALEYSVEYASVVAFGTGTTVADPDEQRHGLALIMAKYAPQFAPGTDYEPPTDHDLARTAVFRMDVSDWTGKQKVADADFPDAYTYPVHTG